MKNINKKVVNGPRMTLFTLPETKSWVKDLRRAAEKLGYCFQRKGPNCNLWRDEDIKHHQLCGLRSAEGFRRESSTSATGSRLLVFVIGASILRRAKTPTSIPENQLLAMGIRDKSIPSLRIASL